MNTDRELLELAAKAAGYRICHLADDDRAAYVSNDLTGCRFYWRPYTDDGDSLRLAEKLSINIQMGEQYAWKRLDTGVLIQEFWGADHPPCHRHAIVRVAAEILMAKS
jgi:hypothetical protein